MFKSPLVRKVTFELLPAALLSFTGSILVAQYFRPAVVITPPSNEASIREDLIRTLRQERAIIHDYMTKIAATNAFNAPARNPADAEAKAPSNGPKTVGLVTSPSSRNVQSQAKTNAASSQQPDELKRPIKVRSDAPLVNSPAIQAPIAIIPENITRADDNDKATVFSVVSRPFERTAFWLKTLKSKIADRLSAGSATDTPRFPGHGIY